MSFIKAILRLEAPINFGSKPLELFGFFVTKAFKFLRKLTFKPSSPKRLKNQIGYDPSTTPCSQDRQ